MPSLGGIPIVLRVTFLLVAITRQSCSHRSLEDTLMHLKMSHNCWSEIEEDINSVLIVGRTKSGVSSLVQMLTKGFDNLTVYENDEGEAVIKDEYGRIGNSNDYFSRTEISEYFEDPEGVFYFDIPAFDAIDWDPSLTGNVDTEVVSTYSRQMAFNTLKKVKLVLVCDDDDIFRKLGNRVMRIINYFLQVKKLIPNIESFSGEIHFLINKVRLQYDDIESDREYLNLLTKYLENTLRSVESNEYFDSSTKAFFNELFAIFLKTDEDENYPRMHVLRVAYEEPPNLIEQSSFEWRISSAKANFIKFENVTECDHSLPAQLSVSGQYRVKEYITSIYSSLQTTLSEIAYSVTKYYEEKDSDTSASDVPGFLDSRWKVLQEIHGMEHSCKKTKSIAEFMSIVGLTFTRLKWPISYRALGAIINNQANIELLNELLEDEMKFQKHIFNNFVQNVSDIVRKTTDWYAFLDDLYTALSEESVQMDKMKYNVKDLENWGDPEAEQGLFITHDNFETFLKIAIPFFFPNDEDYSEILKVLMTIEKINDLDLVIERAFRRKPEFVETEWDLYITGENVFLSEFIKYSGEQNCYILAFKNIFDTFEIDNCRDVTLISTAPLEGDNFIRHFIAPRFWLSCRPYCSLRVISDFKEMIISESEDKIAGGILKEAYLTLVKDDFFNENYTPTDFITSYQYLLKVKDDKTIGENNLLFFSYQMLEAIMKHAKTITEGSDPNRKALAQLATSISSKITDIRLQWDENWIMNPDKYLEKILADVNDLKNLVNKDQDREILHRQFEVKEEHKDRIIKEMNEIQGLMEKHIKPEIDQSLNDLSDEVQNLLAEIEKLKAQPNSRRKELKELETKLKGSINKHSIAGVINFTGNVVGFFFNFAKALVNLGDSIMSATDLNMQSNVPEFSIPSEIFDNQKSMEDLFRVNRNITADFLGEIVTDSSLDPEIIAEIETARSIIYSNNLTSTTQTILQPVKDLMNQRIEESKQRKSINANEISKALVKVDYSTFVYAITAVGGDKEKLEIVEEQLKNMERVVGEMKMFQETVEGNLMTLVNNVRTIILQVTENLANKTGARFDVAKWQVKEMLNAVIHGLSHLTKGKISSTYEKVNDALVTMVSIYDRIQNWHEQQYLTEYIANIVSPEAEEISITDETLENAVDEINVEMKKDIIRTRYNMAISAFKQWIFPFADLYLFDLKVNDSSTINETADEISRQLESVRSELKDYHSHLGPFDQYIQESVFNSDFVTSSPFCRWSNDDEHQLLIEKFLFGEEILLSSVQCLETFQFQHAIKFNLIELDIRLTGNDKALQEELKHLISHFDIKMIHYGNNYYRYNYDTYLLSSEELSFTYSYERGSDDKPIRHNKFYEEILKGDLMLSPFTIWKFKLLSVKSHDNVTFQDFNKFKGLVHLELTGRGEYITAFEDELAQLNLDKHYMKIDWPLYDDEHLMKKSYRNFDLKIAFV